MKQSELLLDTCAMIHLLIDADRLTAGTRESLEKVKIRWICDVSLWEIAIKQKNGKLSDAVLVKVYEAIRDGLIKPISLSRGSLEAYCALDFDSDHKDPFDRLIISTAHVHDLPIVTTDARILAYQNRWNLSIMN